jgi:alanyl-tRNA synthetase
VQCFRDTAANEGAAPRRNAERLCVCPLQGALLGIDEVFTPGVAAAAVELSGGCDPEVAANAERIYAELRAEELRFRKTLAQGRRVLADMLQVGRLGGKL